MFECFIDKSLKYLNFTFFSEKIEKKSKNHKHLMFECCVDKCIKVSKFYVFFRKNRKKVEKSQTFDV